MTLPAPQAPVADIMEAVLLKGDLARLTPDERVRYYGEVCKSMGINPLTKPFEYIILNGKLQLYALRSCTDQLRKINGVSLEIVSREVADDILTIHVRARLPDGRTDEDLGAVAFPAGLKGDNRANAELKAVTKAKRRATLSICGLGWLDETEVADIPARAKAETDVANGISVHHPDDYADGTPEKDTKPPELKKQSRREQAVAMHTENVAVMCKMLKNCQSIDELKQVVDRIKDRHDYQALEIAITSEKDMSEQYQQIKNRIVDTWAATLARLKQEEVADQVIIDDDGERPATPEDFDNIPRA